MGEGLRRSLGIEVPNQDPSDPQGQLRKVMARAGTPHYMAPEMHGKSWYDERVDMFSVGIMTFQMLTGVHPFYVGGKDNAATAKEKILVCNPHFSPALWNLISPLARQFVEQLLTRSPVFRPTSERAAQHPWFNFTKNNKAPLRHSVVEALLHFRNYNKMKQAVLRLLAKEIDEQSVLDLREQFITMDRDNDGTLSFEEVMVRVA